MVATLLDSRILSVRAASITVLVGLFAVALASWHAQFEYYFSPSAVFLLPLGTLLCLGGSFLLLGFSWPSSQIHAAAGGALALSFFLFLLVGYALQAWSTFAQAIVWLSFGLAGIVTCLSWIPREFRVGAVGGIA